MEILIVYIAIIAITLMAVLFPATICLLAILAFRAYMRIVDKPRHPAQKDDIDIMLGL